jgi:hypothetical protein
MTARTMGRRLAALEQRNGSSYEEQLARMTDEELAAEEREVMIALYGPEKAEGILSAPPEVQQRHADNVARELGLPPNWLRLPGPLL